MPRTTGETEDTPGMARIVSAISAWPGRESPLRSEIIRWDVALKILSWTSSWNPVIKATAMIRAATPMVMPRAEMKVMTEIKACLRRAVR
jgi:hypothetical protein